MSTLLKTRRIPTGYRHLAGGVTEICYSPTPETIVVLPGTRWLEKRRERENRLALAAQLAQETEISEEETEAAAAPMIGTELTEADFVAEDAHAEIPEITHDESISWTDRMRIVSTRLISRQSPWAPSLRGEHSSF